MTTAKNGVLVALCDRLAAAYVKAYGAYVMGEGDLKTADDLLTQFRFVRPVAEREAGCALRYAGIDYAN